MSTSPVIDAQHVKWETTTCLATYGAPVSPATFTAEASPAAEGDLVRWPISGTGYDPVVEDPEHPVTTVCAIVPHTHGKHRVRAHSRYTLVVNPADHQAGYAKEGTLLLSWKEL